MLHLELRIARAAQGGIADVYTKGFYWRYNHGNQEGPYIHVLRQGRVESYFSNAMYSVGATCYRCYEWERGDCCVNCLPGVRFHMSHYCAQCNNTYKRGRMKMDKPLPFSLVQGAQLPAGLYHPTVWPLHQEGLDPVKSSQWPHTKGNRGGVADYQNAHMLLREQQQPAQGQCIQENKQKLRCK